jgi:1,4-alpha-glucan branching enzyme
MHPALQHGTLLSDLDLHLFNEGTHVQLADRLGAHLATNDGVAGAFFAVWAPEAATVSVMGEFNGWDKASLPLQRHGTSGVWQRFVPGIEQGAVYKYHVVSRYAGYSADKADPFAFHSETPPRTGSVLWDLEYDWGDRDWMASRAGRHSLVAPWSVYEVHAGSWRRVPEEGDRPLGYRELAPLLADYAAGMGFTHVELLPVMEHPFGGSWGYQTTGYFAPTARYGTPQDLMFLVDTLHQNRIGVILDWVPSHFTTDLHGLGFFDGSHLYEHADARQGIHPDWDSFIFNYGRNEVRSFLLSSAMFWLGAYHADALRVDAVASMLYLDYSRQGGEWIPNEFGGRENLKAVSFVRRLNREVYRLHPDVQTVAEESTAYPLVTRPAHVGGLGFGLKWDMGWMHDTLDYMRHDPLYRKHHQRLLTFRPLYASTENFVLPLSHDEVVHGKGSLLGKMPGDEWQRFANLRLLLGLMWAQPGKKLLFMGGELGQRREWNHDGSLDWHLLGEPLHAGVQRWVRDLNHVYRSSRALHEGDCEPFGFEWVDCSDDAASVISFLRWGRSGGEPVLVVCNFTPVPRYGYRVGVPRDGFWWELLNSDALDYGGSGVGNGGGLEAETAPAHARPFSLALTLPPLGALLLKPQSPASPEAP